MIERSYLPSGASPREDFGPGGCHLHVEFNELLTDLRERRGRKRITIEYGCFLHIPFFIEIILTAFRHQWLQISDRSSIHENDLTIHIRSGDIWQEDISREPHDSYCALPFSFYETIIREYNWRHIHIVTENRNDPIWPVSCPGATARLLCREPLSKTSISSKAAPISC